MFNELMIICTYALHKIWQNTRPIFLHLRLDGWILPVCAETSLLLKKINRVAHKQDDGPTTLRLSERYLGPALFAHM